MGITNKLIQWGWIDAEGRSLTWQHWNANKKPRQAVAYMRNDKGTLMPLYNFLQRDSMLRRNVNFRERKAA